VSDSTWQTDTRRLATRGSMAWNVMGVFSSVYLRQWLHLKPPKIVAQILPKICVSSCEMEEFAASLFSYVTTVHLQPVFDSADFSVQDYREHFNYIWPWLSDCQTPHSLTAWFHKQCIRRTLCVGRCFLEFSIRYLCHFLWCRTAFETFFWQFERDLNFF